MARVLEDPAAAGENLDYAVIQKEQHVLGATGVNRGDTPAVWDAVGAPDVIGPWAGVDQGSGKADFSGNVTAPFPSSGRWLQT